MQHPIAILTLASALALSACTQTPQGEQKSEEASSHAQSAGQQAAEAASSAGSAIVAGAQAAGEATRATAEDVAARTRDAAENARQSIEQQRNNEGAPSPTPRQEVLPPARENEERMPPPHTPERQEDTLGRP